GNGPPPGTGPGGPDPPPIRAGPNPAESGVRAPAAPRRAGPRPGIRSVANPRRPPDRAARAAPAAACSSARSNACSARAARAGDAGSGASSRSVRPRPAEGPRGREERSDAVKRWRRRGAPGTRGPRSGKDTRSPEAAPEEAVPEMAASRYRIHDDRMAEATLPGMLARVPGTAATALRWAWRASPRDTAATLLLHAAAGVFGAVALIAVAGVLEELFSAVPTADRVAAALPALLALAGAAVARGALQAAAGWAQARLKPQVERRAEVHLFDLTARIELESFDDSSFNDAMYRARDRGLYEAGRVIDAAVEVLSAAIGLAAVAGVLAVLHPVLLPLLALTVAPTGWAAVRAARMRYRQMRELTNGRRRKWTLGDLLASRDSAAELRAYTMGRFLLEEYTRLADRERAAMLAVA